MSGGFEYVDGQLPNVLRWFSNGTNADLEMESMRNQLDSEHSEREVPRFSLSLIHI